MKQINKLNVLFLIVIAVLALLLFRSCGNEKDFRSLIDAKEDTLRTFRNEDGQQVAQIRVLQTTAKELKKQNAGKDSSLLRLQKLVDKHTIAATVHNVVTGNNFTAPTEILKYDTVKKNDTVFLHPVYTTKYENKWEKFDITASSGSFKVDYKVYNEFDHQVRYNKLKWYKPRVAEISATNLNPNTETKELKSFSIPAPNTKKVFAGGVITGALVALVTGIFLTR